MKNFRKGDVCTNTRTTKMRKTVLKTLSCSLLVGSLFGTIPVSATETVTFSVESNTTSRASTYAWADDNLQEDKDRAIRNIKNTVVRSNYRSSEQSQIDSIISSATSRIESATSTSSINSIVSSAKTQLLALKTDAEYTREENEEAQRSLANKKTSAKQELANYKNKANYRKEGQAQIDSLLTQAGSRIDSATTEKVINSLVSSYKAKLDAVQTNAQLTAQENSQNSTNAASNLAQKKAQAKTELSSLIDKSQYSATQISQIEQVISSARTKIDQATSEASVDSILAQAKNQLGTITKNSSFFTTENRNANSSSGSAFEQTNTSVTNTANSQTETENQETKAEETTREGRVVSSAMEEPTDETKSETETLEEDSAGAVSTADTTTSSSNANANLAIMGGAATILAGLVLTKKKPGK